MRGRWFKIVFGLVAILALGLVSLRLLSPEGREATEHYQCLAREEARAADIWKLIATTLEEGQSTKVHVRRFLEQNFADLPIHESQTSISAGPMRFSFDQKGVLAEITREIRCAIV